MQEQIFDALRRGAHDEALASAQAAIDADPQSARAHLWLAMALSAAGRRGEAMTAIDRAIALAPDNADLHFHRAGLLLGARELEAADSALSQAVMLDPNQFGAYIVQAQLALGRGDLDEAERLNRLAARVAPEHPWSQAVDAMLALRRGDADQAVALASRAAERAPEDSQVVQALGLAYMAKGHLAFAEQAFRTLIARTRDADALRVLLAQLLQRQGRPQEAAEILQPLLEDAGKATPALQKYAGQLELAAGRVEAALPLLRAALVAAPHDLGTIEAIAEAWRRTGDATDARNTLESLLETSPDNAGLWRARLAIEADADAAASVAWRWCEAMPQDVPALEARLLLAAQAGNDDVAEAVAKRIVALDPGRSSGERYLVDAMVRRNETEAAVARVQGLLDNATADASRRLLRGWLALLQDRAGMYEAAAGHWAGLNADAVPQKLPLPEPSRPRQQWPDIEPPREPAPAVAFLYGPPGSGVERLAWVLQGGAPAFRADRFGTTPPSDQLQQYTMPKNLLAGTTTAREIAGHWRDHLAARGIQDGSIIDWLLWWDPAMLAVLREEIPQGRLIVALRDPRDMLLNWMAFGAPAPFAIASPKSAAAWLAIGLNQLLQLHEESLYPHHLIRLDALADDPAALVAALDEALDVRLPVPPVEAMGTRAAFPPGHWRNYAEALAGPFAMLTPVAKRLGYPEA